MIRIEDNTNGLYRCDITAVLTFTLGKLGVTDADVTVFINDRALERFSNDEIEMQAITYEAAPGKYALHLRSSLDGDILIILCHEAVHLSQYLSGRLKFNLSTGVRTWNGQRYSANYPYMDRPWEIEAFTKQGKLLKEYRRTKKRCIL